MGLNSVSRWSSIITITITSLALLGCDPSEPEPDGKRPYGGRTYAGTFSVVTPGYTVSGSVLFTESMDSDKQFIATGNAQVDYSGCASFSGMLPLATGATGNGELTFLGTGYRWVLGVVPFTVTCNGQPIEVVFGPLSPCDTVSLPGSINDAQLSGTGKCGDTNTYTWSFTKGR